MSETPDPAAPGTPSAPADSGNPTNPTPAPAGSDTPGGTDTPRDNDGKAGSSDTVPKHDFNAVVTERNQWRQKHREMTEALSTGLRERFGVDATEPEAMLEGLERVLSDVLVSASLTAASAAAGAISPDDVEDAARRLNLLADVDVDIATRTVKTDLGATVVAKVKETKPHLFAAPLPGPDDADPPPNTDTSRPKPPTRESREGDDTRPLKERSVDALAQRVGAGP